MSSTQDKKQARAERQQRREEAKRKEKRQDRLMLALGGVVLIAALGGIVWATAGGGDDDAATEFETGDPAITGEPLAQAPPTGQEDGSVGTVAPAVTGQNFAGEDVTLYEEDDDTATIAVFLAHWCPVCNREIPKIVNNYGDGSLPDGVEFVAVSTGVQPGQANYPPSAWLQSRDWQFPIIADSSGNDIAQAYGLQAYPMMVALGDDGEVLARTTGELPESGIQQVVDLAAASVAS
jgi:peroxiredoxin